MQYTAISCYLQQDSSICKYMFNETLKCVTLFEVGNQCSTYSMVCRGNIQYMQFKNMQQARYGPLNAQFKVFISCPGLLSTIGLHVVFITVSALNETVL